MQPCFFLTVAGYQVQQTSPGRTGERCFPSVLHSLNSVCVCYYLTLSTTVKRTASSLQLKDKVAGGGNLTEKELGLSVRSKWHCEMKLSGRKENNSAVAVAKGRFSPHYPHPQDYEQSLSCPQTAHGHKLFPAGEDGIQFISGICTTSSLSLLLLFFITGI